MLRLVVASLALLAAPLQGQDTAIEGRGEVQGRVVDGSTGQPLPRANVSIEGTTLVATTDLHGRYTLEQVPVGQYRVVVRLIGYTPKTITNVTIDTAESTALNVTLTRSVFQLSEIEVTAEVERGSAVALIDNRRAASVVTNAIGSEEMSRSPDSDAAESLKRVTGMSVVDDRSVVIRGLSDRYSAARLNGGPLPSPEPDKKSVPLDLFPNNLLESIVTSKTYSPDQPGDYSGGLVDIQTKDFPGQRSAKLSVGVGYNTNTSFQDGLRYPGGKLDFVGIDDGTRALPDAVPGNEKVIDAVVGDGRLQEIGRSFSSIWEPRTQEIPVNHNVSVSLADGTRILGAEVGVLAAGTYSNSFSTKDLIERVLVTASQDEEPETDYSGEITERTVRWSLFGKTNILLSPTNQFTVRSLYSRSSDDQARQLQGYNRDRNANLDNYRLRFITRTMWSSTVEGDHLIPGLGDTRFQWRAGHGKATSDEPDRREVVYEELPSGQYVWRELTNSGLRYFTSLDDTDLSGSADLIIPFGAGAGQIKFGGMVLDKDRDFFTRRFRYRQRGPLGQAPFESPDVLFSAPNIAPNMLELEEDTRRTDNYVGKQITRAGYVMFDASLGKVRFSGGARLERVKQTVNPFDLFPLGLPAVDSAVIDNTDVLPGINLTYSPSSDMNIRAAFSRTVARPEFREQAPFDFVDFAGGFLQVGNPALKRAGIFNYDLRWEWFPQATSIVAVSGFFKGFNDPIEAVVFPSSELIATWDNNQSAELFGAEFEFRTGLGGLTRSLETITVAGNLTLVHSAVQSKDSLHLPSGEAIAIEARERALQGQSPYLINGSIAYTHPSGNLQMTALYNRFGRRIDKVGTQVLPDVFEEPLDQLDLVVQQRIGFTSLRISASNLLNDSAEFHQAGQLVRRATRGRSISFSFSIGTNGS